MATIIPVTDASAIALAKPSVEAKPAVVTPSDTVAEAAPVSDAFGPAVELDLSQPAQDIVDAPATPAASTQAPTTAAPARTAASAGGAPAGGGAPIASAETEVDLAAVLREVAAQVGVAAATNLVDDKGNIDRAGLAEALADMQAAKTSA